MEKLRRGAIPGAIMLKAKRNGLESATVTVSAVPLAIVAGLVRMTP
jgi:hypothetical protein